MNWMQTAATRLLILIGILLVCAACQSTLRLPEGTVGDGEVMAAAPEANAITVTVQELTPVLTDLEGNFSDLRATFNAHPDVPRLILLLSPT